MPAETLHSTENAGPPSPDSAATWTFPAWIMRALGALVIVALGTLVLYPVLNGPWAGDDDLYLTGNTLLLDPHRVWKAWFEPGSFVEYYPLQQTVQWIEFKWFGIGDGAPFYYRVPNLVLHLASALLVWALFARLRLKFAWLGGLLFAIHPENVDSVAQITELKNTLSLPPFLVALIFFVDYEDTKSLRAYSLAFAFFVVAMLCKISMAFFPFFMPIYAWWKNGRVTWRDAAEAVPFLCVSLVLSYLSIHAGDVYAKATGYSNPGPIHLGGVASRVALAGMSLAFYFSHCYFPLEPRPIYPLWNVDPPSPLEFLPWLGVVLVLAACWARRRTWGRHVFLGLSFFTLAVLPFLGFHDVTYFCLTWVQDHFLYLPLLGILGLVLAGLEHLQTLLPALRTTAAGIVGCVVVALLAFESHDYASIFAKPLQLWSYNYASAPNSWCVDNQLGRTLIREKHPAEALPYLVDATRINPGFWLAWDLIGESKYALHDYAGAIEPLQTAIKCDPRELPPREFLGRSYSYLQRFPQAEIAFRQLLQAGPNVASYHGDMAVALAGQGRIGEAIQELQIALSLDPSDAHMQNFLQQLVQSQQSAPPNP